MDFKYLNGESHMQCRAAGDIEEMGRRLAHEVIAYVAEVYGSLGVGRISFIGHSLGGIIGMG